MTDCDSTRRPGGVHFGMPGFSHANVTLAVAALLVALAVPRVARAQLATDCDVAGRTVTLVRDAALVGQSESAIAPSGERVIRVNPAWFDALSQRMRRFTVLHECGHHVLGHLHRHALRASDEQAADCYALEHLGYEGWSTDDIHTLQTDLAHTAGPGRQAFSSPVQRASNLRTVCRSWSAILPPLAPPPPRLRAGAVSTTPIILAEPLPLTSSPARVPSGAPLYPRSPNPGLTRPMMFGPGRFH